MVLVYILMDNSYKRKVSRASCTYLNPWFRQVDF